MVASLKLARRRPALVAALVAISLPGAAVAEAEPPARSAADRGAIAIKQVGKSPREIAAAWTGRRMRRAEPLDVRRMPRSEPAREPRLHSALEVSRAVSETTAYPNRTHGKVFFKINGADYVCSGTVVPSAADDLMLTAGHCVYDAGGTDAYVQELIFVPGYRDGNAPLGIWPAETLATTTQWQAENFNYDLAFAKVSPVGGRELEAVAGARGIAFNQPRDQAYQAYGYPAGPPFDGETLRVCDSAYFADDPYYLPPGPAPMGIGCDMTGGSSGGGWVTAGGYVASVTSFGYNTLTERNHLYGPYFESVAKNLYAGVDGAPGTPANLTAGTQPAPADTAEPADTAVAAPRVIARPVQRQRRMPVVVKVRAGAGEPVRGTARGRIVVKGKQRAFRLRTVTRSSAADELARYRLKPLRRAAGRRILRLLDRGYKLRGLLEVSLVDEAGNEITQAARTRLR